VNVDLHKVDRHKFDLGGLGTSAVRFRVLAAALTLLAAGCMALGWGSRSKLGTAKAVNQAAPATLLAAAEPSFAPQSSLTSPSLMSPGTTLRGMTPSASSPATARPPANAASLLGQLPLFFEPNQGQANLDPADSRARFIAHGSAYSLALGSDGAILSLRSQNPERQRPAKHNSTKNASALADAKTETFQSIGMKLVGANPNASLTGSDLLPGKSNYLLGSDPAKWHSNVPQFARVRYENVYPGINMVFYGNQGHLEYDLQVAPGADPSRAELEFDGANVQALKDGSILLKAAGTDVRVEAPRVYQKIAGREQPVDGHFVLRGANRAGFAVGPYDHSRELVIDPALAFSAYFGGAGNEAATSVAVDSGGNVYLTGSTTSSNLPVQVQAGVVQNTLNGAQNVYVAKINPALSVSNPSASLVYVTYLGGNGVDTPAGIAVDGGQDAYVAGTTSSTNFPTTGTAYQTPTTLVNPGAQHVFVTELNPTATLLAYSSYLSGNGVDTASGMTIDNAGFVYVTGSTTSTNSPTILNVPNPSPQFPASQLPSTIAFQSTNLGPSQLPLQFFVTKVNTRNAGNGSIQYSTYFGGAFPAGGSSPVANGGGIAVDTNGNIYFDGTTNYTYTTGNQGDFWILDAYQPCLNQPPPAVVTNPPQCTNSATVTFTDAFFAKLNPNAQQGEQLQWSSYFGGANTDSATGIAVDTGAVNVFITGTTNSSPAATATTNFASFQQCLNTPVNPPTGTACSNTSTNSDAYVARFTPQSPTAPVPNLLLNYFSYLGGTGNDEGLQITVDTSDNAYLTGWTQSVDFPVFPTPGNLQTSLQGTQDAFIAHLNTTTTNGQNQTGAFASYFGGTPANALTQGTGVALDVNDNVYFAGNTNSTNLQVTGLQEGGNFINQNAGGFDAFVTELRNVSGISITGLVVLGTNQTTVSAGNPVTFQYTITNNGPDPASNLTLTDDLSPQTTGVNLAFISGTVTSGTCSGGGTGGIVSCNIPTLQVGGTAQVTVEVTPASVGQTQATPFNGGNVNVLNANNNSVASAVVSTIMTDFSFLVTPNNQSVAVAGDTAPYQAKVTPLPVYGAAVSLSCTGAPSGAACSFAPTNSVILPSTSPAAALLSITTTARPIQTASAKSSSGRFYAIWFLVPGFALLGMGATGNRRRRRLLGFLMLCALFVQLLLLPACSGQTTQPPVSGTPAGTYQITVTATSGSDSKSYPIQLTVP
jgi:uncharacterized repeat protein (TIGR01451 family)